MGKLRIKKAVYVFSGADAASNEQFGDNQRKVRGAREFSSRCWI